MQCKRLMVPLLLLLVMVPYFSQPVAWGREATSIDAVTIDGDICYSDPNYTRDASGNEIHVYYNTYYRGFIEWDISEIPDTAIVESVSFRYRRYSSNYAGTIYMRSMESQPSAQADSNAGNEVIYDDAADGDMYLNGFGTDNAANTWYTVALPAAAVADVQANLAVDWFAVGFYAQPSAGDIYSDDGGYTPELLVLWHLPTDYAFYFEDAVYENNTDAGTINVTAHMESGVETFTVDGSDWWYSPNLPLMFSWDIGGGYARYIYVIDEENFTVTLPDDTFSVYSFAIRDYTLNVDVSNGYLEASRVIGGSETLVERAQIKDAIDDVSLHLVTGAVYRIRIRLQDDTVYDFGYFTPGIDTSRTLVIDNLNYDDYAYVANREITVQAFRLNATHIQINYEDTHNDTTSIYAEITYLNGTQVYNSTVAASTLQVNWYNALDYEGYIVLVNGTHPLFRDGVVYKRTFSPWETHPDFPDFEIMGLTVRMLCSAIVFLVGCTISAEHPEVGLFAATSIAAAFVYYGALPLNWTDIMVLYAISVGIGLGGRGR